MRAHRLVLVPALTFAALGAGLAACTGAALDDTSSGASETAAAVPVDTTPTPSARPVASPAGGGTARVRLVGDGVDVEGDYPTTLCGADGAGEGMSYQTQADAWQITLTSGERQAGDVRVFGPDGAANVAVTVNAPGRQLVLQRGSTETVRVADDFSRLEAELRLRGVATRDSARLTVTFACE